MSNTFNGAWAVLKDSARELHEIQSASVRSPEQMGVNPLMPSTADPQQMTHKEVLDMLIHHGGIIGRMKNKMGSPEWSEDMDGMENSGVFEALNALYGEHEPNGD